MGWLPRIVVLAGLACVAGLVLAYHRSRRFGSPSRFAPASGSPAAGAHYAFTAGMAPRAKESVRGNPLSYAAGLAYHGGIGAAVLSLGFSLAKVPRPAILAVVALLGGAAGAALLGKRLFKPVLRGLSCPDDYLANGLVTVFVALAGLSRWWPGLAPFWWVESAMLLLYIPLGKIRHCLFFFPTRYHSGAFFGRRGVFPPGASRA